VLPDQDVGYCLALAVLSWLIWIDDRHLAWLALGVVFLGAAASIKSEGLVLGLTFAIIALVASVAIRGRAGLKSAVLLIGPAAIIPWLIWLHVHHQPLQSDLYSWGDLLRPHYLGDRFGRLTYSVGQMLGMVFGSRWLLVVPAALSGIVMLGWKRHVLATALLVWFVVAFIGLAAVYWISPADVHWYVETSAARVVASLPIVAGTILPLVIMIALRAEEN
jgi:hypothetical protein